MIVVITGAAENAVLPNYATASFVSQRRPVYVWGCKGLSLKVRSSFAIVIIVVVAVVVIVVAVVAVDGHFCCCQ